MINKDQHRTQRNPWFWVPSLYLAEGLPYVLVMTVSVVMYKRLEISNTEIAFYTSWLYLPWVIKPFWSPFVDLFKTKRFWILIMQFVLGAGLAGIALTIPTSDFFRYTLAFFWLIAFSSATHDIAADGFYMLALSEHKQAWFVGVRTIFYRIAFLSGQGLLVILAGELEVTTGNIAQAWMITFLIIAGLMLLFAIYHSLLLPKPLSDKGLVDAKLSDVFKEFMRTFRDFFSRKQIVVVLLFLLLYRFGEAQLAKLASPFLLDSKEAGGLALTTSEVGFAYGTVGMIALSLGGLLGGFAAAKKGLKFWIWWMLIAINLPDVVYIYLATTQTDNFFIVNICVAVEQFGYGFGFTAYLLYMIYVAQGKYKTAHYAFATGIMAFGMMMPGMISGWLEEMLGYQDFFIWVLISTIPAFVITKFVYIDPEFGKKKNETANA